jgi:hypothetical protein
LTSYANGEYFKLMIPCTYAIPDRSLKLFPYLLIAMTVSGLWSCSPPERLSVMDLYVKKNFSGRDLSGQTIALSPLFTAQGVQTDEQFSPKVLIAAINNRRQDIRLQRPDRFIKVYREKHGEEALDSLYRDFFNGSIVSLQTNERVWKVVGCGYLMVLKLNFGLKTQTLDQKTVRQMRLEGELWDCDSGEVVWRKAVDGRSRRTDQTDKDLLLKVVVRLFDALPASFHGYGKGSW